MHQRMHCLNIVYRSYVGIKVFLVNVLESLHNERKILRGFTLGEDNLEFSVYQAYRKSVFLIGINILNKEMLVVLHNLHKKAASMM